MKTQILPLVFAGLSLSANASDWRTPDPQHLLYLELESGRVIIELAPQFAPNHVAQIKRLARAGFYQDLDFYRVVEGFVAQGGDMAEKRREAFKVKPVNAEFEIDTPKSGFYLAQEGGFYGPKQGYYQGFPVVHNPDTNKMWMAHCAGVINMARSNSPHSGTSDFAIMLGQAARHLDRNMSAFGQVIWGMEHLQGLQRFVAADVKQKVPHKNRILNAHIAADLPRDKQTPIELLKTQSKAFKDYIQRLKHRTSAFFFNPPPKALNICYPSVQARLKKTASA